MTVLEHDPVVADKTSRGIQPPQDLWRVSKGDAGWTDRQFAATMLGAAAGGLALAISLYLINKQNKEVV